MNRQAMETEADLPTKIITVRDDEYGVFTVTAYSDGERGWYTSKAEALASMARREKTMAELKGRLRRRGTFLGSGERGRRRVRSVTTPSREQPEKLLSSDMTAAKRPHIEKRPDDPGGEEESSLLNKIENLDGIAEKNP
jgi:hypothetical protein